MNPELPKLPEQPTDQELMDFVEGMAIHIVVCINRRDRAIEELERRLETSRLKER